MHVLHTYLNREAPDCEGKGGELRCKIAPPSKKNKKTRSTVTVVEDQYERRGKKPGRGFVEVCFSHQAPEREECERKRIDPPSHGYTHTHIHTQKKIFRARSHVLLTVCGKMNSSHV